MNKTTRTVGSLIALAIGFSASGCSPSSTDASDSPSAPSSATSTPSSTNSAASSRTEFRPHTAEAAAATLNEFFAAVDEETGAGLAKVTNEVKDENLTPEEVKGVLRENYPESLKYVDQNSLTADKAKKLIGVLGALRIISAEITADPTKIEVSGDYAVVPHEALRINVDKVDHPAESGSITLKYRNGKWFISDYQSSAETAK